MMYMLHILRREKLEKDVYPRYIISLDRYRVQQEGVKHINAIDLFLGKVVI